MTREGLDAMKVRSSMALFDAVCPNDISGKVLLIGGGKDHSSASLPRAYKALKNNGSCVDWYWDDEGSHYLLLTHADEVMCFLNKHYGGVSDLDQ